MADTDHRKLLRNVFAGLYSLDSTEYETDRSAADSSTDTSQSMSSKRVKTDSVAEVVAVEEDTSSTTTTTTTTTNISFEEVCRRAIAHPERYVMKPQREGGGNNIYGPAVAQALQTMSREELKAFILMERIFPPSQTATLVREGSLLNDVTLCELGVYGVYLSDKSGVFSASSLHQLASQFCQSSSAASSSAASSSSSSSSIVTSSETVSDEAALPATYNKYAGFLLRVKPANSDEGGVAAGYSVLSAPSIVSD